MNFEHSPKVQDLLARLAAFMDAHVYPNERRFQDEIDTGARWQPIAVVEELKARAKAERLWNLFLPESEHGAGPVNVPPARAAKHGHEPGDQFTDELIEDLALHYSWSVYHPTSTCRIGSVVDPQLRVLGVQGLRVADASIIPDIVSGNTNAACIMSGDKAAELIGRDYGLELDEYVG